MRRSLVQKKLARNPRITPKTQLTLAESEYNETRQYLAQNKSITKRVQLILAKSEDRETKARLADNPNIHLKAQLLLAKSKDEYGELPPAYAGGFSLHSVLGTLHERSLSVPGRRRL
jgi:hypothetical protein